MIYVVINSCKKYVETSLPLLLKSLDEAQVPRSHIHCVIGESDEAYNDEVEGIAYHYVRYCNLDNNAFLFACDAIFESTWFVYLHDTCVVHPDFWNLMNGFVATYDGNADVDAVSLRTYPSMNIGLYRTSVIQTDHIRHELAALANFSKDPQVLVKIKENLWMLEDHVFRLIKTVHLSNSVHSGGPDFYYGDGTSKRYTEKYPWFGVTKYKANNVARNWVMDV